MTLEIQEKLVEKKRVFKTRATPTTTTHGPSANEPGPSASSANSASPARVRVKIEPAVYTRERAKQWLPKRKGCVLEFHYQSGWGVKYPTLTPPGSRWRAFDPADPRSNYEALKVCIGWAWERHHEQGGDACPHDFE